MLKKVSAKKVSLFLICSGIILAAVLLWPKEQTKAAGEATATYSATEDATVWNGSPSTNYGNIATNEAGHTSGGDDRFFLVKFQDLALPADATITSAQVKLVKAQCSGASTITAQRIITAPWDESTVTYLNYPGATMTGATSLGSDCGAAVWNFDVTAIVNAWRSGQPNYGIMFWGAYGGDYRAYFYSSESGVAAWRPQLVVNYTTPAPTPSPEPEPTPTPSPSPSPSPTPPSTPDDPDAPVDTATVLTPKVAGIEVNGTAVQARDKSIEVTDDDKITVTGKAPAGSKVVVTIGDKEYTAMVDEYGDWKLEIKVEDYKDGKYEVMAKAVTADNKESNKVKLFEFEKKESKVVAKTKAENDSLKKNMPYLIGAVSVLVVLAAVLAYLYIKKHKHVKRLLGEAAAVPNTPPTVPPVPPAKPVK